MIEWTIAAAKKCSSFDNIVVSSDDEEILRIANQPGVVPDRRSPELSGDRVRFVEVLEEFLTRPENAGKYTAVAVLLPTCPFRSELDIRAALALHALEKEAFVVSISAYEFPPDFACDFDEFYGTLRVRQPEVYERSTQSQSVAPAFHPNGAIYVGSVKRFLASRSFFAQPVVGSLLPPERALDLDHPHQWEIAEALAQKHL